MKLVTSCKHLFSLCSCSPCSSGSSQWRRSWPASLRLSPQSRTQKQHRVFLPQPSQRIQQTRAARTSPSQTQASSRHATSRRRRRTASWAAGRRTLWRRCELWAQLRATPWTAKTAACWRSTCRQYSRGRRKRRTWSATEQRRLNLPQRHRPTNQRRPTLPHRRHRIRSDEQSTEENTKSATACVIEKHWQYVETTNRIQSATDCNVLSFC